MKKTKVQFIVNEEDLRSLTANVMNSILTRFGTKYSAAMQKLNNNLMLKGGDEIEESLEEVYSLFESQKVEFENLRSLYLKLKNEEVPASVTPTGTREMPQYTDSGHKVAAAIELGDGGAEQLADGSWKKLD